MKKHMHLKTILFIGLFAITALSACTTANESTDQPSQTTQIDITHQVDRANSVVNEVNQMQTDDVTAENTQNQ